MNQVAQYSTKGAAEVGEFLDSVTANDNLMPAKEILDSIKNEAGFTAPAALQSLLSVLKPNDEQKLLDSVMKGVGMFRAEHGAMPTGDVVEAALSQGLAAFNMIGENGRSMLDAIANTAHSGHHDPMSLQPNRAVVAVLTAIAEAIPFASYLPVDIASNQAKLAILQHEAGSLYGDYVVGGLMDGVSAGNVYASSSRMALLDVTGTAPFTSKFTQTNLTANPGYCDPAGTGVPILRGRTIIYVNGKVAAVDAFQGSGASSPISGSVRLGSTDYAVVGTVNVTTGALSITSFTPALPAGSLVTAQAFVDYEAAPALIPSVVVRANTYDLYANPWRVSTSLSIDANTQLRNELGLDGNSEALMMIRTQMAMERHYLAIRMAAALAKNNVNAYDFDWSTRNQQMSRAQIWQDLQANLSVVDQKMANDTMDHGITHMYVGSWLAGIMQSLGPDQFVPSGVVARPSIYRVGRLFGKYEVYYTPKYVAQANNLQTASILAVGRSSQVARCPIVLGDAVSPTFVDVATNFDLKKNAAVYARDFTVVNPHEPSALGCAEINLTDLAS